MCGRYTLYSKPKDLAEHFQIATPQRCMSSYNVAPSNEIPVIRLTANKREFVHCHWGLIPHWAKDTKIKPINAKAETLSEKPFFRTAYKKNRCLIPVNGFYEWQGTSKPKQPYYFKLRESDVFAFAGLWDAWELNGKTILSCTIITTEANFIMNPVHHRMPVILNHNDYNEWLTEGNKNLLTPYAGKMKSYPVSTAINNPNNNNSSLIHPIQ